MPNQIIVEILARRVINQELNPKTGLPLQVADIKIEAYRIAVEDFIVSGMV